MGRIPAAIRIITYAPRSRAAQVGLRRAGAHWDRDLDCDDSNDSVSPDATGVLRKYALLVSSASQGAVTTG